MTALLRPVAVTAPRLDRSSPSSWSRVLLVDLDGTVADFKAAVVAQMAERSDGRFLLDASQCVSDSIRLDYFDAFGLPARQLCDEITSAAGFYRSLPLVPDAVEALSRLAENFGWMVVFCTAPSPYNATCVREKFDWVDAHFGADAAARMVVTRDKTLIQGRFLIDDLTQLGTVLPSWELILFDAPYNRSPTRDCEEIIPSTLWGLFQPLPRLIPTRPLRMRVFGVEAGFPAFRHLVVSARPRHLRERGCPHESCALLGGGGWFPLRWA